MDTPTQFRCQKQVKKAGMNFAFRTRQCKRNAVEGSEFCAQHQPDKPAKPVDEGKENLKRAMYYAKMGYRK